MKRTPTSTGSTRERLNELAPLAAKLNAATDEITHRFRGIEAELEKLAIGLDVRLDVPLAYRQIDGDEAAKLPVLEEEYEGQVGPPSDAPVVENSYLAYGRHSDGWRLLVRRCVERRRHEDDWVLLTSRDFPLVGASRELRLAAWEQIDDLLGEIARRAQRKLRSLNMSISPDAPVDMASILPPTPPSPTTNLEREFDDAMVTIYRRAKSEAKYPATRFLQMLNEHGGLETARILLHANRVSEGYTALWERKRLDLTVEAVILDNSRFHALFSPEEVATARKRLAQYEYPPAIKE